MHSVKSSSHLTLPTIKNTKSSIKLEEAVNSLSRLFFAFTFPLSNFPPIPAMSPSLRSDHTSIERLVKLITMNRPGVPSAPVPVVERLLTVVPVKLQLWINSAWVLCSSASDL